MDTTIHGYSLRYTILDDANGPETYGPESWAYDLGSVREIAHEIGDEITNALDDVIERRAVLLPLDDDGVFFRVTVHVTHNHIDAQRIERVDGPPQGMGGSFRYRGLFGGEYQLGTDARGLDVLRDAHDRVEGARADAERVRATVRASLDTMDAENADRVASSAYTEALKIALDRA